MEFSRGYGDHVAKARNFRGGGGCPARPSGTEIHGGWGVKLKKSSVGGVWIFSGTTQYGLLVFGS